MSEPDWIGDLFKEKSLWATFLESKKFPSTTFNRRIRTRVFPIAFALLTMLFLNFNADVTLRGIDAASALLASVTATIIGFLVAGLAIFTTLSDKKILIALAQTPQKDTQVTTFKYLYFNLLNVFLIYIWTLIFSCAANVISKMAIPIGNFETSVMIIPLSIVINAITLNILFIAFFESMLTLKTFIWNIYATFVSVLTVSTVIDAADRK